MIYWGQRLAHLSFKLHTEIGFTGVVTVAVMKSVLVFLLLLPTLVCAQATMVERAFIARANAVRDSLGLEPLVLLEGYREVSVHHARYVYRTGHFSHDQEKRKAGSHWLPSHTDRVRAYGPSGYTAWAEILTGCNSSYTAFHHLSEMELASRCVANFMGSPPHRQALLNEHHLECTVGIMWTGKKYVCVVNFLHSY